MFDFDLICNICRFYYWAYKLKLLILVLGMFGLIGVINKFNINSYFLLRCKLEIVGDSTRLLRMMFSIISLLTTVVDSTSWQSSDGYIDKIPDFVGSILFISCTCNDFPTSDHISKPLINYFWRRCGLWVYGAASKNIWGKKKEMFFRYSCHDQSACATVFNQVGNWDFCLFRCKTLIEAWTQIWILHGLALIGEIVLKSNKKCDVTDFPHVSDPVTVHYYVSVQIYCILFFFFKRKGLVPFKIVTNRNSLSSGCEIKEKKPFRA